MESHKVVENKSVAATLRTIDERLDALQRASNAQKAINAKLEKDFELLLKTSKELQRASNAQKAINAKLQADVLKLKKRVDSLTIHELITEVRDKVRKTRVVIR